MKTPLLTLGLLLALTTTTLAQLGVRNLHDDTTSKAARKMALVVGNIAYKQVGTLKNSLNDARDMGQALQSLGFEVTLLLDVTSSQFEAGLAAFGRQLRPTDIALIYFSGHAGNFQGHYYLFPTEVAADCSLTKSGIDLNRLLNQLAQYGPAKSFVLLDAGNYTIQLDQCSGSNSSAAQPAILGDCMIVYAAQPGGIANENPAGRNSVFTSELLKYLTTPGLGIRTIIDQTILGVRKQTNGKQSPTRYDNLTSDFTFSRFTTQSNSSGINQNNRTAKPSTGIHSLPLEMDLSRFSPPVIDQGKIPNDVGWVTAYYAYTTQYAALRTISDPILLKQTALSPMLPYKQLRPNCEKGLNLDAIAKYIIENGDVSYEEYPYESCDSVPSAELLKKARQNHPIKGIIKIFGQDNTNREKIFLTQEQLGEYKTPVIIGIKAADRFKKLTASDDYYQPGGNFEGLHAVAVVGYNRVGFKILNSWGPTWGRDGYFRMQFDDFAKAAIGGLVLVLPDESSPDAQKK